MRFFVDPSDWAPPHFLLRGEEAHHAARVMRVQAGTEVQVFQGEGKEWSARVELVQPEFIELIGLEPIAETRLAARLVLLQALPKGAKMEWIIQKAVELGVAEVQPLAVARSVVKLDPKQAVKKVDRWQKIATEAAKQCGHPRIPQISAPQSLSEALTALKVELLLLTSLQPETVPLLESLNHFRREHKRAPHSIAVLIGPEGDFNRAELAACLAAGARSVTLGPLVLRTETAALAALAQIGAGLAVVGHDG